jgi:hypothetical protein
MEVYSVVTSKMIMGIYCPLGGNTVTIRISIGFDHQEIFMVVSCILSSSYLYTKDNEVMVGVVLAPFLIVLKR